MSETAERKSPSEPPRIVKTPAEVLQAHDLLLAVITAVGPMRLPIMITDGQVSDVAAYASVLCWLLGHEHNPVFGCNLTTLDAIMRGNHFVLAEDGSWHFIPSRVN